MWDSGAFQEHLVLSSVDGTPWKKLSFTRLSPLKLQSQSPWNFHFTIPFQIMYSLYLFFKFIASAVPMILKQLTVWIPLNIQQVLHVWEDGKFPHIQYLRHNRNTFTLWTKLLRSYRANMIGQIFLRKALLLYSIHSWYLHETLANHVNYKIK